MTKNFMELLFGLRGQPDIQAKVITKKTKVLTPYMIKYQEETHYAVIGLGFYFRMHHPIWTIQTTGTSTANSTNGTNSKIFTQERLKVKELQPPQVLVEQTLSDFITFDDIYCICKQND